VYSIDGAFGLHLILHYCYLVAGYFGRDLLVMNIGIIFVSVQ